MPSISVNDLPDASSLSGLEVIHGLQNSSSRKITAQQIANLAFCNAMSFGVDPTGTTDCTTQMQTAVNTAWNSGRPLFIPTGIYQASIVIPPVGVTNYTGHPFKIFGDGAGQIWSGEPNLKGTRIVAPGTSRALHFINRAGQSGGPNVEITGIRFDANNSTSVAHFERFADWSEISHCEFRQNGSGDGVTMDHGYGGTITHSHCANYQLVAAWGTVRTGTAFKIAPASGLSGGLLTLHKTTARGFELGYHIGGPAGAGGSPSIVSVLLDQVEGSTLGRGVYIGAGVRKGMVHRSFFEAVETDVITDEGQSTSIRDNFIFGSATHCFARAIVSTNVNNFGNVYSNNEIQLSRPGAMGIDIYTDGAANGHRKVVRDNFFYNNSVSTDANVIGIRLTGADPTVVIDGNTFRPRRTWSSAGSSVKIKDDSTGIWRGPVPISDSLEEYTYLAGCVTAATEGATLTEANVTSGVLSVGAGQFYPVSATTAVNVNSLDIANLKAPRVITFRLNNSNMTFVDGTFMRLAGSANFSGNGTLVLWARVIAGQVYCEELSRALL